MSQMLCQIDNHTYAVMTLYTEQPWYAHQDPHWVVEIHVEKDAIPSLLGKAVDITFLDTHSPFFKGVIFQTRITHCLQKIYLRIHVGSTLRYLTQTSHPRTFEMCSLKKAIVRILSYCPEIRYRVDPSVDTLSLTAFKQFSAHDYATLFDLLSTYRIAYYVDHNDHMHCFTCVEPNLKPLQVTYAPKTHLFTSGLLCSRISKHTTRQATTYLATCTLASIYPGQKIQLHHHPQKKMNQTYTVIAVAYTYHSQTQSRLEVTLTTHTYVQSASTHKASSLPLFYQGKIINNPSNTLAPCNHDGKYPITYDFSTNSKDQRQPLYFRQLNTGRNTGIQFSHRSETPVLVCDKNIEGNAQWIQGVIPTRQALSPVTQKNRDKHLIHSHTGHGIAVDDKHHEIKLYDLHLHNTLRLSETNQTPLLSLKSAEGKLKLHAQGDILQQTKRQCLINAKSSINVTAGGDFAVTTTKDNITFHAKQKIKFSARKHAVFNAQQDILFEQTECSAWHVNGDYSIDANQINIIAKQGRLSIKGKQRLYVHSSKKITLIGNAGSLTLKNNTIHFKAKHIIIDAQHSIFHAKTIHMDTHHLSRNKKRDPNLKQYQLDISDTV